MKNQILSIGSPSQEVDGPCREDVDSTHVGWCEKGREVSKMQKQSEGTQKFGDVRDITCTAQVFKAALEDCMHRLSSSWTIPPRHRLIG